MGKIIRVTRTNWMFSSFIVQMPARMFEDTKVAFISYLQGIKWDSSHNRKAVPLWEVYLIRLQYFAIFN